jgi:pSer/pThr/pTyr-binding forkhead associated (FHA) protein
MKVSLTVLVAGPMEGKTIPLTVSPFVIGRAPQCHLQPGNLTISELHCALEIGEDNVIVRDLRSVNGTFVNDRRIHEPVLLDHGDRLRVGPLIFGLLIEADEEPPPPPPAAENKVKRTPDTAEMPAGMLPEPGLKTDETVFENKLKTEETVIDNEAKKAADKEPKPAETASLAAKALLKRYLRRKREPLE